MDPAVADSDPREARMLAAIVFTDVVGFSKLAAKNEARVYVALQRDMSVMTNLCRAHGGQVLNTMGDGMLLCFSSAVDALGCAVEIQRTLYNQSLTLPSVEILRHRIGVHLGDVIMNGDNVFGDGVNVASRLQTIAQPGAVCFSHTVHEVVKNKLKVDATFLGPRQLKNIGEPVKVWQVPSLGLPKPDPDDSALPIAPSDLAEASGGAKGATAGALVLASIVLIGLLIFAITRLKTPSMKFDGKGGNLARRFGNQNSGGTTEAQPTGTTGSDPAPTPDQVKQQTVDKIQAFRKSYDFAGIVGLLNRGPDDAPAEMAKLDTYRRLSSLQAYLEQSLAKTTDSDPLQVSRMDVGPNPEPVQVYELNGNVVVQTNEGQLKWADLTPLQYLEIANAAVANPMPGTTPNPDLPTCLQAFSTEFGVTLPQ